MKKLIIFGTQDTAQLAHYYMTNDSEYKVVAFTLHSNFKDTDSFLNLPVIEFEQLLENYPPNDFDLFIPMTGKKMNKLRENVFNESKLLGYQLASYLSSKSSIFNTSVGENCFILEDNTIQPFVKIGNNVTLWSGNHIGHHSTINDHVFFTSHVTLSGHCEVDSNCWFGVNSSIRDYCKLKKGTLVGMGANLSLKETDEWGVYMGNPAVRKGKIPSFKII